ncbi:MAG: OmpW family outer membrane protein [Pseudomonadota bacterium]
MKLSSLICVLIIISFHVSAVSAYEPGDWIVRIGPALIEPNDDSDDVQGIPGAEVGVDNDVTLGFTIGYMLTSKWAVELLGVLPANHDLQGRGSIGALGKIGDVDVLPPTLSLQYHFLEKSKFNPYVGAGINYTHFSNESTSSSLDNALGGNTDLDIDDSWGPAVQAGLDVSVTENIILNASLWYVDIEADATLKTGGTSRDVDIDIDPWVFFLGVGMTF